MSAFPMFEELLTTVRSLGVNIVVHSNKIFQQLISDGIEIEDEKSIVRAQSGIYNVLPDGRIVKVVLHITQKALYTTQIPEAENYHKYHLFNCSTLEMMQSIGRGDRYRMASRGDGLFNYTITRKQKVVRKYAGDKGAPLHFCRNCLVIYNSRFNRFGSHPFDLRRFIETNELHGDVSLRRIALDDVPNVYAADWAEISRRTKEARNYICEECGVDLSSPEVRRFLHAHHIDGQMSNNVLANIKILCISCHEEQPLHAHIRNNPAYAQFQQTAAYINHFQKLGRER